ncbi:MAG: class I SAM-dependent methyltransferase, partial [Desulfobacterales bacterium]
VQDGVPLLAVFSAAHTAGGAQPVGSTVRYEQQYEDFERAQKYNLKYERQFLKRLSTKREHQLLRRLLGRQAHCARILEIPCGGGRISPQLAGVTDLLIQADIGLGQVRYGKTRPRLPIPQVWMTASAFHIPLRDAGVDAVVCIRLAHHLGTAQEREDLVVELLRVARRYVIMTFFDDDSLKNNLRRLRGKKPKRTMKVSRVAQLAANGGAELAVCPRLAFVGSGHRYALMVKTSSRGISTPTALSPHRQDPRAD